MILKQILQVRARRPSTRHGISPRQAQIARATHAVPVHAAAAATATAAANGARNAAARVPDAAALAAGRRRALERVAARRRQAGRAGRRDAHAARALVPGARGAAQAEQRRRGAAAADVRHLRPCGRLRGARGVVARGEVRRRAVGGGVEARAGGGGEEERGGRGRGFRRRAASAVAAVGREGLGRRGGEAVERHGAGGADGRVQASVPAGPVQQRLGVGEVLRQRGALDAAVERPGHQSAPCEDRGAHEAQRGAHADEDGAVREVGFLHEGRVGGVRYAYRGVQGACDGREAREVEDGEGRGATEVRGARYDDGGGRVAGSGCGRWGR